MNHIDAAAISHPEAGDEPDRQRVLACAAASPRPAAMNASRVGWSSVGTIVVKEFWIESERGDPETLRAAGADHHQARAGGLQVIDGGERADVRKRLGGAWQPDLLALREQDNAEGRSGLVATADHVQVTHLEDPQGQDSARKQHHAKGEQRQ